MAKFDFDLIVIGSGPGGYVAAIRASQLGLRVACIEKEMTLGGTCLNIGCIPSKTLLQSTEHFDWIKNSSKEQGIEVSDIKFNFSQMMKRKEDVVKNLVDGVEHLFKTNKIERLRGRASFLDPHQIQLDHQSTKKNITAESILIATGSESISLPFLNFDETSIVSSTGALSLSELPKRLVVIGGGAIGVEMASIYSRLGVDVTIVEVLKGIAMMMDSVLSQQLLLSLTKQGIKFLLDTKVIDTKKIGKTVRLFLEKDNKTFDLDTDLVLVAVGRRPFTLGLGLEKIGIRLDSKGFIPVDINFRTLVPNICAIGDVIQGPMLAHRASYEGIACVEVIKGLKANVNYMSIPNVIYTHPEVAAVGLTEIEAREAGFSLMIGTSAFRGNPRARCSGNLEGLVKVIGDKNSRRLLGLHIFGELASEMIAEGVLAIDKKATVEEIANACHAHPTRSEAVMEACQQAIGRAIHATSNRNLA